MGNVDVLNIQFIRLLRLTRLLRIVRLARTIQAFDSLYLMTTALSGSLSVLLWVFVVLLILHTLFSLIMARAVQDFYLLPGSDASLTSEDKKNLYMYFGTYWRSMISLFELMLANWPPICRLMMELWEPWSLIVIAYKLTMGFTVIGIIFGVFTQETFRAAETDDQLMVRKKKAQSKLHAKKMKFLFGKVKRDSRDSVASEDECINLVEFKKLLEK